MFFNMDISCLLERKCFCFDNFHKWTERVLRINLSAVYLFNTADIFRNSLVNDAEIPKNNICTSFLMR